MRYAIVGLFLLVACGDPIAPGIACESEKRAELSARFGTDFSPTDALLRQSHWNLGTTAPGQTATEIDWAPDCTKTVR